MNTLKTHHCFSSCSSSGFYYSMFILVLMSEVMLYAIVLYPHSVNRFTLKCPSLCVSVELSTSCRSSVPTPITLMFCTFLLFTCLCLPCVFTSVSSWMSLSLCDFVYGCVLMVRPSMFSNCIFVTLLYPSPTPSLFSTFGSCLCLLWLLMHSELLLH